MINVGNIYPSEALLVFCSLDTPMVESSHAEDCRFA